MLNALFEPSRALPYTPSAFSASVIFFETATYSSQVVGTSTPFRSKIALL